MGQAALLNPPSESESAMIPKAKNQSKISVSINFCVSRLNFMGYPS
jgi:hypothetical protein